MRNAKLGTGGALLRLAAVVLLGAAVLAIVYRSTTGPGSGANDLRFGWQAAGVSPGVAALARPVALASGLVLLTSDGAAQVIGNVSATAWRSSDGSNWSRLSQPGAISEAGRSITIVAACPDGHGGLVAAGQSAVATDPTLALDATIWHSSDGRTWERSTVDGAVGATVQEVAVGSGTVVAVGLAQPGNAGVYGALAWYSSDGATWRAASISGAAGHSLLAVAAWRGGFVAIGSGLDSVVTIWTSTDGSAWTSVGTLPSGFEVRRLAAFANGIVALGNTYGKPASLTSGDARSWTQVPFPVRELDKQSNVGLDDAVEVEGRLVAFGYSAIGVVPEATNVPPAQVLVWVSNDGLSWRLLPPDATLAGSISGVSVLGSHIIVTTSGPAGSPIYLGTPAG